MATGRCEEGAVEGSPVMADLDGEGAMGGRRRPWWEAVSMLLNGGGGFMRLGEDGAAAVETVRRNPSQYIVDILLRA
jgi:hypothetical protein